MKNDKQKNNNVSSFIKENGFLIALYSVVGVLVVVAVSLTFFMPTGSQDDQIAMLEDSQNVSTNLAKSYKTQVGTENADTKANDGTTPSTPTTETQKTQDVKKMADPKITAPTSPAKTSSLDSAKTTNDLVIYEDDQTLANAQPSTSLTMNDSDASDSDSRSYTFSAFDGDKTMLWPTNGEVVVGYSPETLVYDTTLEQYKTTDSIDIAAGKGEDVFAAYDGVVKMISKSVDQGNYIVIDHGNGWVTTYSQLDDSMKVAVGDEVKKGQQIGMISDPSTKSVLLGTHLDFKVTKNDQSVNPLEVLE